MKWEQLYSAVRTGKAGGTGNIQVQDFRNEFIRDYDRLIFSSAFRRLQNKTQVFPLPGAVFVHNRLTHSLEVASVGRSLGKAVGDQIADRYPDKGQSFESFYRYELPSVIAAACLAHDIGNPPFGHSGEDAIRIFFRELEGNAAQRFKEELSAEEQADFLHFEGNANALRTLTHHFNEEREGGFNLTLTTIASIVKYPCSSLSGFQKGTLAGKKSGFFSSEKKMYEYIAASLQIPSFSTALYARHPFVFLVEAADDICYRIIDFEDAHRLGIISTLEIADLFLSFFPEEQEAYNSRKKVTDIFNSIKDDKKKVQYLRAGIINLLIQQTAAIFMEQENALLDGSLQKPLIDLLPASQLALIKKIDDFSVNHIYNHRSVVEVELTGYTVISYLLKELVYAVLHPNTAKSRKLLQLVPAQFPIYETAPLYKNLQSVTDYVAGMTDLYALELYHKLTGSSFGIKTL